MALRFALCALALAFAAPALAQPVPDTIRSATLTQTQANELTRRLGALQGRLVALAGETQLREAAVRNIAVEIFGAQPDLDFETYASLIDNGARELRTYLSGARDRNDTDTATQGLRARAIAAAEQGRLTEARALYDQLIAANRAARREARDAEDLADAADIAESARLAFISADFRVAVQRFAEAAEIAPESAQVMRAIYRRAQADTLRVLGERFGDLADLRASIDVFERQSLPGSPRESSPEEWAFTQHHLGLAYQTLGQRGDVPSLDRARAAYEAGLTVTTRDTDPLGWARLQIDLGNLLEIMGSRGLGPESGTTALRGSRAAYEAALSVLTRDDEPELWAHAQSELGTALTSLSGRGEPGALPASLVAFEAALTVITRDKSPQRWATTRLNMGNSYEMLSHVASDAEARRLLEQAIAAYEDVLTVNTPASNPVGWALAQMEMGASLTSLAALEGPGASQVHLAQAVASLERALTIRTRERNPQGWALTQYNLARAHHLAARHGDRAALERARTAANAALAGYQQAGSPRGVGAARNLLQQIER